ncbi:MAG TPA: hypothetical protein VGF13_11480 [Verrucomicrobiae bacterium]|jgi:hypothetical protein
MKKIFLVSCWIGLGACALTAQESELETLKKALQEQQKTIQSLLQKVEALEKQQSSITSQQAEWKKLVQTPDTNRPAIAVTPPAGSWSPTDPIRIGKGATYADLGLVATFAVGGSSARDIEGGTQPGGHDPNQRGFTVQGVELNLQGAVDTYFRGNANILFSVDSDGESFLEVEEAWLETMSLPWNLQLRAGQILTDFGRLNTQHPHAWAFLDSSLVNTRFLGADGLRNPGARLAWLAPTPFFTELSLCVQNSHGETAESFRSSGHSHPGEEEKLPFGYRRPDNDRGVSDVADLLFTPRLTTSFDLTDEQTLVLGTSAAFGPNANGARGDTSTQIYGVDAYWKWKPANHHGGFPFVSWQTEAMLRRYELGAFDWDENGNGVVDDGEVANTATGLPAVLRRETVTDWGFYSQALYGFHQGWMAGLRGDFVTGERGNYERLPLTLDGAALGRDPLREERWRISPNLTWYPTEFSKLRLQYNYDRRRDIGEDHSVWFQFEFLLGAHAAHKF